MSAPLPAEAGCEQGSHKCNSKNP